jgi:chloramphenicol-sensitive protein RarD
MNRTQLSGLGFALAAYLIWGGFPLYWKQLAGVDPVEVLAHRVLWTLPFAAAVVHFGGHWRPVRAALRDWRQLSLLVLTAALIALNWGVYIWAVANDRVLEASLGYYLTPLVSVLLGVVAFAERLRPLQWAAVAFAAAGVAYLMLAEAAPPWAGLTVAFSFGLYGALRKRARVDSAAGLFVETAVLAPAALAWVAWLAAAGNGAFAAGELSTDLLLMGAGVMTAVPLLCYVAGTRRLPLATMGVLFYLTPSLQFLLGTLVYDERLSGAQAGGFGLIWCGLLVYVLEEFLRRRRVPYPMPAPAKAPSGRQPR